MNYSNSDLQKNSSSGKSTQSPAEEGIRVNGFQQVLEILRYADPEFRESLLKRLGAKDPQLSQNLRRYIAQQKY